LALRLLGAAERAQGIRDLRAWRAARAGDRLRQTRGFGGVAAVELDLRAHVGEGRRVLAAALRAAVLGLAGPHRGRARIACGELEDGAPQLGLDLPALGEGDARVVEHRRE